MIIGVRRARMLKSKTGRMAVAFHLRSGEVI